MRRWFILFLVPLLLHSNNKGPAAAAFGFDLHVAVPSVSLATTAASSSPAFVSNMNPISVYLDALATYPLPTKMMTGATLAVAGDAIAQNYQGPQHVYDQRRAVSFAVFDMLYRALQHAAFPAIVAHCHGQYLATIASLLFSQYYLPLDFAAALERTLCSQLGIVPFLYYPVFYTVTAYAQRLSFDQAIERAKQTFVPLMERNLLFWIPVQFIQFSLVPEDLQIPFVCVCGLFWTFVLSVMAGSATTKEQQPQQQQEQTEEEVYCVIGTEDSCVISEDHLFPDTTLQGFSEELSHEIQDVAQFISHEVEEITHIVFDDDDDNQSRGDDQITENKEAEETEKEQVYK